MSVVDTGLDGEHRAGGVKQDALGIGPQDQLADRSASTQADHDEVRVDFARHLDQVLRGFVAADKLADLVLDSGLVEVVLNREELSLEPAGFIGVEVLTPTAGVDHNQFGAPQKRFLRGTAQCSATFLGRHVTHNNGHLEPPCSPRRGDTATRGNAIGLTSLWFSVLESPRQRFTHDLADLLNLDEETIVTVIRSDDMSGTRAGSGLRDLVGQPG